MIEGARVVVGVDGSLSSLAAVRRAAVEARRRDAVLVPVIAWMACDGDSLRPLSELEFAARVRLDSVVELAFDGVPRGLRIHPRVVRSEAGRALVAMADRPSDLLVVGSGGHGGPQGLLHGSVARYCWARADCEVLVVPATGALESLAGEEAPTSPALEAVAHCHAGIGYLN
ncbi:universal stress protein [Streptacidiphilus sp. N1-12]|uniref:Universal stress protein n=2 Tax=Streptacidiphilus alkalitolerans TaxID=3342712 RepID=A0ABV6VHN3_9ACTN